MRAKAVAAAMPLLLMSGMVLALERRCEAPDAYVEPYHKTTKAALALRKANALNILIVSSAPSQTRSSEKQRSYPSFLESALKERLPNHAVQVHIHSEPRKTVHDVLAALPKVLETHKPALVIWQTGTVEAVVGMDADKFESKLEQGIERIKASGADVLLINPQFSPRTALTINSGSLNERIRRVASYSDVPLFNRYDIMRYWNENDVFDFTALKNDGTYEVVHRCLGGILAEFVSRAASFSEIAKLPR